MCNSQMGLSWRRQDGCELVIPQVSKVDETTKKDNRVDCLYDF